MFQRRRSESAGEDPAPPIAPADPRVAELEQALDRERAARREVERRSALKDEFLSAVAHELNTPLNAITGWTQILRRATTAGEVNEAANVIERNARAQARMVQDLLDVSRILSGRIKLEPKRVELNEVVEAAIDQVVPAANERKVRIATNVEAYAGAVMGDPARLQQVVAEVVGNAVKFTPAGGTVTVGLEGAEAHVELTVTDTGAGIAAADLPHVFDRFTRGKRAAAGRRAAGLGLGLTLAKHLVDLHHGTIRAESDGPGTGSTFVLRLPLAVVFDATGGGVVGGGVGAAAGDPRAAGDRAAVPRLDGLGILIVDDDPDARTFVRRVLEDAGADAVVAASMDDALAALDRRAFDLLVSDISMPDHDGYELIHRVRSRPAEKGGLIRALALTALTQDVDLRRSIGAGYNMHLNKPVDADDLIHCVARLLPAKLAT